MLTRKARLKLLIHGLETLLFWHLVIFTQFGVGFFALPGVSHAADFYITQNASGNNTGADCADALPASWFNTASNWANPKQANKIGPGDTVHLCGTFTGTPAGNMLSVQGSGASGQPITILFESGAVLSAPYWLNGGSGQGGAINFQNHNYITVDGGTNGVIQNTATGNLLTYQAASIGIEVGTGQNCTIKNLTISNIYGRSGTLARDVDQTTVIAIHSTSSGAD